jgi:hypothetical protein
MDLRNLHILAKIKARPMAIQLTKMPWHCYKTVLQSIRDPRYSNAYDGRYTPIQCSNSCWKSGGRSVGATATYYFDLWNKIKNAYEENVSSHVINHQHVSIAFCDYHQGSFTRVLRIQ